MTIASRPIYTGPRIRKDEYEDAKAALESALNSLAILSGSDGFIPPEEDGGSWTADDHEDLISDTFSEVLNVIGRGGCPECDR
jgi:hypothetical protein